VLNKFLQPEIHYAINVFVLPQLKDRAIAKALSRWLLTATARGLVRAEHVGFVVDKVALRQLFSEYFGSPASHHSTNLSIVIVAQGWHNRPIGDRSAEWTQLDSTPPPTIPI
jgi:hypothetical protein